MKFYNQILLVCKVRYPVLGFTVPLSNPQAGKPDISEPLQQWENFLVLLFCSLWVTHPVGMEFDFIMIVPLLPSCCGFFIFFECRVNFSGGLQHPPVDSCSTANCNFGAFTGGDEHTSFYSAILNQKPLSDIYVLLITTELKLDFKTQLHLHILILK